MVSSESPYTSSHIARVLYNRCEIQPDMLELRLQGMPRPGSSTGGATNVDHIQGITASHQSAKYEVNRTSIDSVVWQKN